MALNNSGPISLGGSTVGQSINLELGVSATALASINSSSFRTLAGVSSGQISLSNFYGKSNAVPYWVASMNGTNNNITQASSATIGRLGVVGGNVYISGGGTGNTPASLKFNATTGAVQYNNTYTNPLPGAYHNVPATCVDSSGNSYAITTSQSSQTIMYTKFNSSGAVVFAQTFGVTNVATYANIKGATCDSSDNVYFTISAYNFSNYASCTLVKMNPNGTLAWATGFYLYSQSAQFTDSPAIMPNGDVLVACNVSGNSGFMRFTSSGTYVQTYSLAFASGYTLQGISVDSSGNIFVVAGLNVAKFNSSYTLQWAVRVGGTGSDGGTAGILATGSGGCMWSDGYNNDPATTYACFINSSGSLVASNAYTITGNVYDSNLFKNAVVSGATFIWAGGLAVNGNASNSTYITSGVGCFPSDGSGTGIYLLNGNGTGGYSNYGYYSTSTRTLSSTSVTVTNPSLSPSSATAGTITSRSVTTTANSYGFSVISGSVSTTTGSTSYTLPGTYSWVCPTGVTSVSVVAVGAGGGGAKGVAGGSGNGGGGGGLAYRNNISVSPGSSYTVVVGAGGAGGTSGQGLAGGNSSFASSVTAGGGPQYTGSGGGVINGAGGGSGGGSNNGAGGAGGYTGNGGAGGNYDGTSSSGSGGGGGGGGGGLNYGDNANTSGYSGAGGGVGLGGLGINGPAATRGQPGGAGSAGTGFYFGGGGSGGGSYVANWCNCCSYWVAQSVVAGRTGAVRIMWPGSSRSFPSTSAGTP